ncbi:MAG: fumarylacetoacetate hydrolase family protein, partial [Candidatus Binatia bacterium]
MKLVTFIDDDQERIGAIIDSSGSGQIVDLHKAYASYLRAVENAAAADQSAAATLGSDMVEFLKRGDKALAAARMAIKHAATDGGNGNVVERQRVRLMAPVPRPGALVSAGKNFSDHVAEMSSKKGPAAPVAFLKLPGSVIGPDDDIPHPPEVKNLDYEVELAVIIGKKGRDIPKEKAYDYVFGYTVCLDMTARELQRQHGQWFKGKSLDTFCPLGPWIVHKSALRDPQQVRLICRVNGEVMQDGNTRDMIFDIPTTIESL